MRPRRRVVDHPQGYGIAGEQFATTDPTLAAAVAAELDRTNPLACAGHGDWIDVTAFEDPDCQMVCGHCGEIHRFERPPT